MSEIEWMDIFGDNLADMLKEKGMTQRELAEDAGLAESTISQYINKKKMPSVRAIVNLAYALCEDTDELIDFGDRVF